MTDNEQAAWLRAWDRLEWPAGTVIRDETHDWRVFSVSAVMEPGTVPQDGEWVGLMYDEGQYYRVADVGGDATDDPVVYRIDHEGQERMPHGERLSERLGRLRVKGKMSGTAPHKDRAAD